jgi:hypothetical protein
MLAQRARGAQKPAVESARNQQNHRHQRSAASGERCCRSDTQRRETYRQPKEFHGSHPFDVLRGV